jgi:hypothetical protein
MKKPHYVDNDSWKRADCVQARKPTQKVSLEAHRNGDVRKDMAADVEEISSVHKTNWKGRV